MTDLAPTAASMLPGTPADMGHGSQRSTASRHPAGHCTMMHWGKPAMQPGQAAYREVTAGLVGRRVADEGLGRVIRFHSD